MPYKDPEKRKQYQKNRKRLRRAGDLSSPRQPRISAEFRCKTAEDVVNLLDDEIDAVRKDTTLGTVERARTIGFLAVTVLRAVEITQVAARLEGIQQVLQRRATRDGG